MSPAVPSSSGRSTPTAVLRSTGNEDVESIALMTRVHNASPSTVDLSRQSTRVDEAEGQQPRSHHKFQPSYSSGHLPHTPPPHSEYYDPYAPYAPPPENQWQAPRVFVERAVDRWTRDGKPNVGVLQSLKAIALSSTLNIFLVFLPLSWVAHFLVKANEEKEGAEVHPWEMGLVFALSFLAIMPLARLFEYVGQQLIFYLGPRSGEFLIITLNNVVEVTLSLILLSKCELKLLQSVLIGVVVLHLLLIPGASFITGGARVGHQELHTHSDEMGHTLLAIGVLSLLLPAAFFSSMTHGDNITSPPPMAINDASRGMLLQISHGMAILLVIVYIGFLIYSRKPHATDPEDHVIWSGEPEINQYIGIITLAVTISLMAVTAEWLVSSVKFLEEEGHINQEFFGLMLLPLISFSADGFVTVIYYARYACRHLFGEPLPPAVIAQAQAIDLSIQFLLFWIPFIELCAWMSGKPLLLLFDIFEVSLIVSACFVVNYVTADAKTNWAEGLSMVVFYFMIGLISWFYKGQMAVTQLLSCGTVAAAVEGGGTAHH
ncbi:hypothetical protein CYLTODRAFT_427084 [Cylindrobasidium torrendii FP15055 ss-10]|uniref:Sodium/calcium exchanger membrane region domain-containing protein n=1 Tax=Cylindrobasidium torrendii FP15055 ss-10 TaxID=1314674 RepID=A0A0D7AV11_9AGAR|nr:hypothetical protein CYLTODRAFT_427084 [Cylindrobasidium torrendii FP15055 ss-10]